MSKRPPRSRLFEWRITRIRSTPAAFVGYVKAPDAEQAIQAAISEYDITNPHQQARLAAQRAREIG
jgi:predicted chitinase